MIKLTQLLYIEPESLKSWSCHKLFRSIGSISKPYKVGTSMNCAMLGINSNPYRSGSHTLLYIKLIPIIYINHTYKVLTSSKTFLSLSTQTVVLYYSLSSYTTTVIVDHLLKGSRNILYKLSLYSLLPSLSDPSCMYPVPAIINIENSFRFITVSVL